MLCKKKKQSQGIAGSEGGHAAMKNIQARSLFIFQIMKVW